MMSSQADQEPSAATGVVATNEPGVKGQAFAPEKTCTMLIITHYPEEEVKEQEVRKRSLVIVLLEEKTARTYNGCIRRRSNTVT